MDLANSFKRILRGYGHDVYLQRHIPGGGFESRLEKHTTRHVHRSAIQNVAREIPGGMVEDFDMVYYFRAEVKPREQDRVYQPDERYEQNRRMSTWIIDYAQPMRGRGGKIVYWIAGVTKESPN